MKSRVQIFIVLAVCLVAFQPVFSISRWFTSSFHDLKITFKRYGNCLGDLPALKDSKYNETDYLVNQITVFLNQGQYDNEHLQNVSAFMDTLCKADVDSYPVSGNINVDPFRNAAGKALRCRTIDDSLDAIYKVFLRVALNKSEPLDFSIPQFYPNATFKAAHRGYNLSDLINTSWIFSETPVEIVCNITKPVKDYVAERIKVSKPDVRASDEQARRGYTRAMMDYLDRLLDGVLGFQRRLYWDSTTMLQQTYSSLGNNLSSLGSGLTNQYQSMRSRMSGLFVKFNTTTTPANTTSVNSSTPQMITTKPTTSATNA